MGPARRAAQPRGRHLGRAAAGHRDRRPRREAPLGQRVTTTANCERLRHRTAAVRPGAPRRFSSHRPATCTAASSSTVGQACRRRGRAPHRAGRSRPPERAVRAAAGHGFATASTGSSLRQLVESCSTVGGSGSTNPARTAQRAGARAPPAVDRLVRVPDGGHRRGRDRTANGASQLRLGCVLVLVEQHRAEPAALPAPTVGPRSWRSVRPAPPGRRSPPSPATP